MNASSWVGFAALLLATVVSTWFMIVYSFRGPWWKPSPDDPHGEHRAHLGYFTLNLTLIFYLYDFRPLIDPGCVRLAALGAVHVDRPQPHVAALVAPSACPSALDRGTLYLTRGKR
jgi:hypothetical protein